jgi:hypothetical protein
MNYLNKTIYANPTYIAILEILEYIIFILILYKYNPFSISSQYKNALSLIVALFYVVLFYFLRENISLGKVEGQGETAFLLKFLSTIALFFLSVVFIKSLGGFLTKGSGSKRSLLGLFRSSILFIIFLIAAAGVYTVFKPLFLSAQKADKGSVLSFFMKLVLYLPCLLLSFIDYIKLQYHITTKPVWLLLGAEAILIAVWFLIPLALHAYATKNGLQLVKEPQYLNKETVVGTFDQLYGQQDMQVQAKTSDEKFNYHYSLSAWFYLNPQPPNTSAAYSKYTNILNYGNKPAIEFNGKLNSLRVMVETQPSSNVNVNTNKMIEVFETKKVLFQKWNNIVINYDHGTMDVFLNGELVGSKPSIAPYMTYESINVGTNNGLHGGVSNVMYYKDNLSRSYIETLYQALKRKAEPFI